MASIGHQSLDIADDTNGVAVALWLKSKSALDVHRTVDSGWEISIRKDTDLAVAKCNSALAHEEAIGASREAIEETLDLVCFRSNSPLELKPQDGDYFILVCEHGKRTLTYRSVVPWRVHAGGFTAVVRDASGNIIPSNSTRPQWQPVLRYYRLSQTREDIFDAYRYMFLAFEALAFSHWPLIVRPREQERAWLLRAISEIGNRINLTPYVPPGSVDLAHAFLDSQYSQIRLPLFHAKKSSVSLPHEGLSEVEVAEAYSRLTLLVRAALNEFYGMQGQGGVLTNYVFQTGVSTLFQMGGLFAAFSLDDTPHDQTDQRFSPKGLPEYRFDSLSVDGQTNSGVRLATATLVVTSSFPTGPIYRVGLLDGTKCFVYSTIDAPMNLDGVDEFRLEFLFSFENLNTPRWT